MRKSFIAILLLSMLCFSLLAFVGCDDSLTITDLEAYSDMQSQTDRIEVSFDNSTGKPFKFNITDEANIREIMKMLLREKLNDVGADSVPPGDNTYITVHQGEKSYSLSVRINQSNGTYYAFATNNLQTKIIEIATARGAYDIKIGVVYQVIDSKDCESLQAISATVADKAELSTLIATNFNDNWKYLYVYDEDESDSVMLQRGLADSANRIYQDKVTLSQGKALVVYEIYKNYSATPYYYVAKPTKSEYVSGNRITSTEFVIGLYNPCKLIISISS